MQVVVMGVSGCGKSSLGSALALRLGLPFIEGDSLHPAENIDKMRAGTPLTDVDRWPWLDRIAGALVGHESSIASCSALKQVYRDRLRAGAGDLRFIHLAGSRDVLARRMAARNGHYMPVSLLDSQLAALEPPSAHQALILDVDLPLDAMVEQAISYLKEQQQ